MRWLVYRHLCPHPRSALLAAWAGLVLMTGAAACALPPDTSKPNTMALNGGEYASGVKNEAIGYVLAIEAGFSTSAAYTLLYPLNFPTPVPQPGLEIGYDPSKITLGQDISFGAGKPDIGIYVTYYPAFNPKMNEGLILMYSLHGEDSGGTIHFDRLDTQVGGQVKGALLQATLYGYYESIETGDLVEPSEPMKLELWNFAFDVTLQTYP
jgi:hypothetical protein